MSVLKSRRLDYILNAVSPCRCVADIGCDHGLLSVALVKTGKAECVIASDISKGSLDKASKLVRESGFSGKVECVLSDGLEHLNDRDTDVIVVSGMGGPLISGILAEGISVAKRSELILCPHSNADDLRIFLYENGFEIKCDKVVEEDRRFYPVMTAEFTGSIRSISADDAMLGIADSQVYDDEYRDYLIWFCELQESIISEIGTNASDSACVAARGRERLLEAARRRLKCL